MSERKLSGGRFAMKTASSAEDFMASVSYDRLLFRQDIQGSRAHVRMLARQGILSRAEADELVRGLDLVQKEIEDGIFVWERELEDVHMNIENRLTELVGEVGKKLHTGRSRNDQVALDFRLFVSEALDKWQALLGELIRVLADQADRHREALLPGCTHMQPAQPVSLAQHLLAYAWMCKRDFERMTDAAARVRISPLGAAALAGTSYPLDPSSVAEELGFAGCFANSMDAVSDRDFALEAIFDASLCMAHLSRLCEDIIIWANPAFGFVRLPDAFSTGSSIMPQKKNPDVAELVRGKSGRVYGALFSLLTTLKGLPMTYNRDLQEDKEPFFDTHKTVSSSLAIMAEMLRVLEFNAGRMRESLSRGFVNATELADYIVRKGLPFREAHYLAGKAVSLAEGRGCGLEDLTPDEFTGISPLIGRDVYATLNFENAVQRRESPGGTGPASVAGQLSSLRGWLEQMLPLQLKDP
jgi:argininosuccinate lyase